MPVLAHRRLCLTAALTLALAACGSEGPSSGNSTTATAELEAQRPVGQDTNSAKAALPACPFRQTGDWHASVEGGRILVNGRVDLLMAGFKPTLTPRQEASPGAIGFDLSLEQEQGAVVNDRPRYQGSLSGRHGKAEIYCGGELIETIDIVHIG